MATMRDLPKSTASSGPLLRGYDPGPFYDEMFSARDGLLTPRPHYRDLAHHLAQLTPADLGRASELANRSFLHQGTTFIVLVAAGMHHVSLERQVVAVLLAVLSGIP